MAEKVAAGPVNTAANAADASMKPASHDTTAFANPDNDASRFGADSGEKMNALTWQGKNDVRIVETNKPKLVDPNDAIVKVTGTTVCGSDLHLYHGSIIELQKGDILGHEYMGIVEQVGPGIKNLKAGDRVVSSFNIGCGQCWMCEKKYSSQCLRTNSSSLQNAMYGARTCGMLGYSHFCGGFAGGQAEFVRAAYADANLVKIPDGVPDEAALYLSDILVTSYHCVVDTGVEKGDVVGVWGAGAIGVMVCKWALLMGASRVIVIDNVQWRLDEVKQKIPEVELLNFAEHKDVPARIKEMTKPSDGDFKAQPAGLNVALECAAGEYAKSFLHKAQIAMGLETDTPEIINEMIQSVIGFGRIGITGVYAAMANGLNIGSVMERGIRLIGNGQAPCHLYMQKILDEYLVPKKIDAIKLIVSHRVKFDDIPEVYKRMDSKEEPHIIKTFVETRFSSPPSQGAPSLTSL